MDQPTTSVAQLLQPLLDELRSEVFNHLPASLHYHNFAHTETVMQNALALAQAANLSQVDTKMLYAAAILHDTGFGKRYGANEGLAAILAAKLLPKYGFNKSQITKVKDMILTTNTMLEAATTLEMLLKDADMGNLGQPDFMLWSKRLLSEWREYGRFTGTDEEWLRTQIEFLEHHAYLNPEAREMFGPGKQQNLAHLKSLRSWPL